MVITVLHSTAFVTFSCLITYLNSCLQLATLDSMLKCSDDSVSCSYFMKLLRISKKEIPIIMVVSKQAIGISVKMEFYQFIVCMQIFRYNEAQFIHLLFMEN